LTWPTKTLPEEIIYVLWCQIGPAVLLCVQDHLFFCGNVVFKCAVCAEAKYDNGALTCYSSLSVSVRERSSACRAQHGGCFSRMARLGASFDWFKQTVHRWVLADRLSPPLGACCTVSKGGQPQRGCMLSCLACFALLFWR